MASLFYASIEEIRMKAGFEKATNLADRYVQAARRDAQAEIDSALASRFTTPFAPVPEKIHQLTIKLAAYTLKHDAYGDVGSSKALEALRKQLQAIADGETALVDNDGVEMEAPGGVSGDFGDAPRMFSVEDIY